MEFSEMQKYHKYKWMLFSLDPQVQLKFGYIQSSHKKSSNKDDQQIYPTFDQWMEEESDPYRLSYSSVVNAYSPTNNGPCGNNLVVIIFYDRHASFLLNYLY